ncbi:hypothetical protein [Algicola sagamiensis]|uniref:hypothetical protein n=1 Tax=Algicola sagamiensis TaxID=163869 RepID=UPI00035D8120|nr:hypothetical protein [Algicola sagamiensis]
MVDIIFFSSFFLVLFLGIRAISIADQLKGRLKLSQSAMTICYQINSEALNYKGESSFNFRGDDLAKAFYQKGTNNAKLMVAVVLISMILCLTAELIKM